MNYEQESKAVCYFLRHDKSFKRDKEGFALTADVIEAMQKKFPSFTATILMQIVMEDEKSRYSFKMAPSKRADDVVTIPKEIRANQGHSVEVDLKLKKKIPPVTLYHGTDEKGLKAIKKTGIQKMDRHHVHLTDDTETASSVGIRHGSKVIIELDTRPMVKDGVPFFQSENGVWLVDFVDVKYLPV